MSLQRLMVYLSTTCMFFYMIGINLLISIMQYISPNLTKTIILKMNEKTTMTQNPNFKYEDWGQTFASFNFLKTVSHHLWLSLGQEAFMGGDAPDTSVFNMEGKKTSVHKYMTDTRPLVLSFGSCT
ncbi:hypothetical protein FQN60_013375 [Etheostoma spectabile]|uniref:Iodothyronine deiodinase n=2 Tax=Etheostoma spectabile TaxID=54343 RepID=A0A5J5DAU0_9PERO|nr:hypothetical protein FQN60_013375 [Etheostoma spectabile]